MKKIAELLKTTAVGGLVFLVPLVAGGMVLFKALDSMRKIALPLHGKIATGARFELLAIDVILVGVLFLVCLVAGIVAKSPMGRRVGSRVESALLAALPGYTFVKGFTDSLSSSQEVAQSFTPVLAKFDDSAVLAFEVERTELGDVVVYLPGAPNPWSGSVAYVSADRVEPLEMSMPEAVKRIRRLGRGSTDTRA